jgi:hypothetical protein
MYAAKGRGDVQVPGPGETRLPVGQRASTWTCARSTTGHRLLEDGFEQLRAGKKMKVPVDPTA